MSVNRAYINGRHDLSLSATVIYNEDPTDVTAVEEYYNVNLMVDERLRALVLPLDGFETKRVIPFTELDVIMNNIVEFGYYDSKVTCVVHFQRRADVDSFVKSCVKAFKMNCLAKEKFFEYFFATKNISCRRQQKDRLKFAFQNFYEYSGGWTKVLLDWWGYLYNIVEIFDKYPEEVLDTRERTERVIWNAVNNCSLDIRERNERIIWNEKDSGYKNLTKIERDLLMCLEKISGTSVNTQTNEAILMDDTTIEDTSRNDAPSDEALMTPEASESESIMNEENDEALIAPEALMAPEDLMAPGTSASELIKNEPTEDLFINDEAMMALEENGSEFIMNEENGDAASDEDLMAPGTSASELIKNEPIEDVFMNNAESDEAMIALEDNESQDALNGTPSTNDEVCNNVDQEDDSMNAQPIMSTSDIEFEGIYRAEHGQALMFVAAISGNEGYAYTLDEAIEADSMGLAKFLAEKIKIKLIKNEPLD